MWILREDCKQFVLLLRFHDVASLMLVQFFHSTVVDSGPGGLDPRNSHHYVGSTRVSYSGPVSFKCSTMFRGISPHHLVLVTYLYHFVPSDSLPICSLLYVPYFFLFAPYIVLGMFPICSMGCHLRSTRSSMT